MIIDAACRGMWYVGCIDRYLTSRSARVSCPVPQDFVIVTKLADTWQAGAHTTLGRTCQVPLVLSRVIRYGKPSVRVPSGEPWRVALAGVCHVVTPDAGIGVL